MQLNRFPQKERFAFRLWRQTVRKIIYKAKTHYFNTHINENLNNHGTVSENSQVHMLVQIYITFKTAYVFNTHFCNIYIGTFLQTLQTAQTSQHWLKSIPKSLNMYINLLFLWSLFSL